MTEELQELEPADEPATTADGIAPNGDVPVVARPSGGILGAPAFNPAADKEYYRFLFAGVVMLLGCLMPWGPEWEMAGYKTLSGAFFTLIAVGMIWSWWGAIATARFSGSNLKWVGLSMIPLIVSLFNIIGAFESPAVVDMASRGKIMPEGWGEFFGSIQKTIPIMGASDADEAALKMSNFLRAFGGGQIVLFFGALYAEFAMVLAIMGGAKAAKEQKAARAQAGASRRRSK